MMADEFFTKMTRNANESLSDWSARWEQKEQHLLEQLKAIDSNVTEIFCAPLRT